jgi:glutaredoxin
MIESNIIAYLKPTCGWSNGVRAVFKKYDLPYEDRDIINNPAQRQEMIEKSGQMLADVSGEEVEAYLLANHIVAPSDRPLDLPGEPVCAHEKPQPVPVHVLR